MNLDQQIELLETSIQSRRTKIVTDISEAKKLAREQLADKATDPKALLTAVAAGFATDQLSRGKLPVVSFISTLSAAMKA